MQPTRREFSATLLGSVMTFGLVEMLWSRDLFADAVKPTIEAWLKELIEMTRDLRGRRLTDLEFQAKMEDLYKRVDLRALVGLVKLDEIESRSKLPDNGALSRSIDLAKVEGLPTNLGFGKQVFGCKKGRSIVPHGHANMCTGFIVLKGKWRGRPARRGRPGRAGGRRSSLGRRLRTSPAVCASRRDSWFADPLFACSSAAVSRADSPPRFARSTRERAGRGTVHALTGGVKTRLRRIEPRGWAFARGSPGT